MTYPPPIRFTGNAGLDWIVLIVAGIFVLYCLKAVRLSRDAVRQALRLFILGFLAGIVYYLWRGQMGGDPLWGDGLFFGVFALIFTRKRSRHIPADAKRRVIERDFKGRTHEYDPKRHHVHHKWAFARGGGHTPDNLRVIDKDKNLKKGKKRPGIWEMFFR